MNQNNEILNDAIRWLIRQVEGIQYGEASIRIVRHGGSTARIERSFIEKTQAGDAYGRD